MSAPFRRRSLSGRLRRFFHGRDKREPQPRTSLVTPDYDEAPQRHMIETQLEIPREALRPLFSDQRPSKSNATASGAAGSAVGKPSSRKTSLENPHVPKSTPAARSNGRACASSKQPRVEGIYTPNWTCLLPEVSPIELFYHNIVAPYDIRLATLTAEDGDAIGQAKAEEMEEDLKVGRQLCVKKSSKDNTTGSIDSIPSEDAITDERKLLGDGEDAVCLPHENLDAKERQFMADAVKRTSALADARCSKVDERRQGAKLVTGVTSQNNARQVTGQPRSLQVTCHSGALQVTDQPGALQRPPSSLLCDDVNGEDQKQTPSPSVCLNEEAMVAERFEMNDESPCSDDITYPVQRAAWNTKARPLPMPYATKTSPPSEALTVSVSLESSSDIMASPDDDDPSDANNPSARIDSAMISMKRTQDRVNVSGKYSQVVVIHGHDRDADSRLSRGHRVGSSSAVAVAEADGVRGRNEVCELGAGSGQYTSFNICGENVYITVGSKKTKIKAYKGKNKAKALKMDGRVCGSSANTKTSGLPSKKKKLKKKLKTKTGSEKKGKGSVQTCLKQKKVADKPCSSATYTKIAEKNCGSGSDIDDETIKDFETISANRSSALRQIQNEDQEIPSLKGSAFCSTDSELNVLNFDLTDLKLSDDFLSKFGFYEESDVTGLKKSYIGEKSKAGISLINDAESTAATDKHGKKSDYVLGCMGGDSYSLEDVDGDWVLVSKGIVGQHQEQDDGGDEGIEESHLNFLLVQSETGPKRENAIGKTLGMCRSECEEDGKLESETNEYVVPSTDTSNSEALNINEEYVEVSMSNSTTKVDQNAEDFDEESTLRQHFQTGCVVYGDDCLPEVYGGAGATKILTVDQSGASEIDMALDISNRSASHTHSNGLGIDTANLGTNVEDESVTILDDDEVKDIVDESGFVDVFALKRAWHAGNRTLKKQMAKYRARSRQVASLQQLIGQLDRETAEMKKLLEGLDRQTAALKNEAAEMRCTLSAVCDISVTDLSRTTDARTLEPVCFRRFTNIRTPLDATNLLSAIRNRMKALGELEILTYRRQLVLHHILPGSTQERLPAAKRVLRALHKGPKGKKTEEVAKKGNIVIEVVSPTVESGVATPSWSEEVTNTDSPVTTSGPFSESVEGETTPPVCLAANTYNV